MSDINKPISKIKPKKILIVEDELPLLRILADKFSKEGFVVFEAKNGVEGYKSAIGGSPDIILLDIMMPMLDGVGMLKELRNNEQTRDIPAIVLTNADTVENITEAVDGGAYDYLIKSDWELDKIVEKVKERVNAG